MGSKYRFYSSWLKYDIADSQEGVENRVIKKRKCADASRKKPGNQSGNL